MIKLIPFFFAALSFALAAPEATKPEASKDKSPLLARFEKTCLQNSAAEGRPQKDLCGCLKANLGAKLKPEQLSLLVGFYEGDVAAKALVQKPENAPLLDFDMEAAEHCLADTKWRAAEGPRAPDADENAGTEIVEQEKIKETMKDKPSAEAASALATTKGKVSQKGDRNHKPAPKAPPAKKAD